MVIARFVSCVPQAEPVHDPAAARLAELVTARRQLIEELTRCTNQAARTVHGVLRRIAARRIARLKADILLIDQAMAEAVAADEQLAHNKRLLRSVPGVGPIVAHTLLALMPELGNLTRRQAASLMGVAPFDCESGTFRGPRRIIGGHKPLRDTTYMAAIVAGQHNPAMKAFAHRLAEAGKPPKVTFVAIMRKLISTLNAMLTNNQPWNA